MPRKRKYVKRRGRQFPNPYLPTLMRLHERWSPEQVASAITMAEENFRTPLSAFLVMELAKMPQLETRPAGPMYDANAGPRILSAEPDDADLMGQCERCHSRPGQTVTTINGAPTVVCGRCYLEIKEAQPAEKPKPAAPVIALEEDEDDDE